MEFEFSLGPYYETSRPKKKLKTSNYSLRHYEKNDEEEEEEKGEKGPGSDSGREQEETCDVARKWRSEDDYNDRDESSSCDEVRVRDFGEVTSMSCHECYEEVHRKYFHEDCEGSEQEPKNIIPESIKKTSRLALLDMDLTQVKAADLYAILSSFLPKDGKILRVTIYPSECGVRQMEEEDEVEHFVGVTDDENDNSDHIHEDKLHAEEKRRLRL
ncbi:pre-rRNA-processing protein ESF1-like [Pistacia vera]|uniref:pre-rRNA-processing protein ESF1-like n=1 Tax=Pistacia vera TaxID=55513 RepID=UPI0012630F4A|nr:pre-rRNA-processing protein ESF1-like [Pistacia vera]